ncbi:stromal cell-derived factor 1-like [Carcharodon carcharias]|uniref:stromal cell-derived factor 1-like n=1 Tax=Carcharodon carcharias TaxID=13397 RepID=UPI001B7DED6E|nr:stromal cell-derived factor 1-like [Carcharodon carcharias]
MNVKSYMLIALLVGVTCINLSWEKPSSIMNRCKCRGGTTRLSPSSIQKLMVLPIPNCPLQIIATLKNNGNQICIHPKTRWLRFRSRHLKSMM